MPEERFYLKFSPEMNKLIRKDKVGIEARLRDELKKSGHDASFTYAPVPGSKSEDRDLVLLLLAAGLTTTLISTAVSRVITAIAGAKQAQMKETYVRPALDGKGRAIVDKDGQPVFEKTEKPGLQGLNQPTSTTKASFAKILDFQLTTGGQGAPKQEKSSASAKKAKKAVAKKSKTS